jgi:hypothetical protein
LIPGFRASVVFHRRRAAFQAESGRSDVVTEQRAVGAFTAIELSGPCKVVVRAQGKPSLELSGERKQLDDIETVVRGDTLVGRPVARNAFHFSLGKRRDSVTVNITASMLKSLKMNGSGEVELEWSAARATSRRTTCMWRA